MVCVHDLSGPEGPCQEYKVIYACIKNKYVMVGAYMNPQGSLAINVQGQICSNSIIGGVTNGNW